jgi:hypothetical protein
MKQHELVFQQLNINYKFKIIIFNFIAHKYHQYVLDNQLKQLVKNARGYLAFQN